MVAALAVSGLWLAVATRKAIERVVAGTPVARTELSAELRGQGTAHTAIGDCLAPRTAAAAILDGRRAALAI